MKKALVKETGELLDVTQTYQVVKMNFTFNPKNKDKISEVEHFKYDPEYYVLSDGKTYNDDDVVVGDDNIRDWKIKKII